MLPYICKEENPNQIKQSFKYTAHPLLPKRMDFVVASGVPCLGKPSWAPSHHQQSPVCLQTAPKGSLTFPKLPFPSTIRKLKSESFIRSRLPLLSSLEMAFLVFSSAALEPVPILALCKGGDEQGGREHMADGAGRMGITNPMGVPKIPPQQLFPISKPTLSFGSLFHGRVGDSTKKGTGEVTSPGTWHCSPH